MGQIVSLASVRAARAAPALWMTSALSPPARALQALSDGAIAAVHVGPEDGEGLREVRYLIHGLLPLHVRSSWTWSPSAADLTTLARDVAASLAGAASLGLPLAAWLGEIEARCDLAADRLPLAESPQLSLRERGAILTEADQALHAHVLAQALSAVAQAQVAVG